MARRTVSRVRVRMKMARPKVTETVPIAWATEDFVLKNLNSTFVSAQLACDAYFRRPGGTKEMLATLTRLRDDARAALTQYLDTEKRKP